LAPLGNSTEYSTLEELKFRLLINVEKVVDTYPYKSATLSTPSDFCTALIYLLTEDCIKEVGN
jgi:hypothetical protein